ncbi:transcription termination factor Rho [Bifidobacterium aerophilum]|uniref:Transcription termination factor Rho n=1 Tax=Bifidobacterium aerophilum TaxID=1798155 RepID=A0A6N9Z676_9BIFI|nr:transcription termination factor Rho [Bifidobacterium aerophilum]
MATSQNLEDMKLPELKELAKQMGLRGTSTMRKPELLATLQAARSGGAAPAGVTVRAPRADKADKPAGQASAEHDAQPDQQQPAAAEAAQPAAVAEPQDAPSDKPADEKASEQPGRPARASRRVVKPTGEPVRKTRAIRASKTSDDAEPAAETAAPVIDLPIGDKKDAVSSVRRRRREEEAGAMLLDDLGLDSAGDRADRTDRRRKFDDDRQQNRRRRDFNADSDRPRRRRTDDADSSNDDNVRDLDDILATLPATQAAPERDDRADEEPAEREFVRRSRNRVDRAAGSDRNGDHNDRNADRHQRRLRGRDRDFDERADRTERADRNADRDVRREEPQDDLVPVAGIVDVLESYAFVRTSGYLPGPNDVYVSMGQVKKYGLRKGDAVHGSIRAPRENDRRNQRQKFVPLQSIDSINGMSVEEAANRPQFSKLTPLYPQERLKQETTPNKLTGRIMDIVSPIGKGQRGLIVSPPKAGKTITLQNIANAIATNNPEVHLMVVLVDERPEEVTDMERTVQGEVISSTFDRPASDHTTVAELAIERAKRLVELGQDVVVLLDSMTRLARAYNIAAPASGRILSGGVDAQALYPPKKFFGAARNIENGGSLTIISSALVETGSKMDEVIFEEFKGTGNMELRLSRELADKRLFPAIDINASGTRREELITAPAELPIVYRLRRLLGGLEPEQAYQTLVPRLKKAPTNRDFLAAISQQANSSAVNGN